MKNQNPGIVEIIDSKSPVFRCKVCGQRWSPNIKPDSGGRFYGGAWQCPNGCKIDREIMDAGK
ncbi:hypothetical protein KAW18_02200 [candidate division WOR-3 bacterium]|nr:hypothetical protein [candidate division WOR-3 bacterium]